MIRSGFIVLHNAYRAKIVADKLWVETARAGQTAYLSLGRRSRREADSKKLLIGAG